MLTAAIAHAEAVVIKIYDGPHNPKNHLGMPDERDAH
jgi:hypothetical protein